MARKDLAGLAALGALGYILNNRDEPTKVQDRTGSNFSMRGGAEDERPAPTGMGAATQLLSDRNENFSNEGRTGVTRTPTGAVPRPRPRPRPVAAAPAAAPAVVSDAQRQYDEANARAKTPEGRAERARMESSQALEAVRPEEAMIGGGGLKGVAALARGLANRKGATAGGEKLAQYVTPELGYSQKVLQNNPTKQLTGPSKAELVARDRAGRTAGREAERKEFNQRGRDRFVESTFEGGMKRGGKVKKMASGGMARSSASSRADGIASRGKTRGKVC